MSTFSSNRQRPPRLSLPVLVSLCKLLGVKQVQGFMFQVSRSVSVPIEKQKFIYSSFNDAVNSWKFVVSVWRWLLNNEMEMTKRSGHSLFDVPCCHLTGGTEKDVFWARFRTENSPERYCLSQLPQCDFSVTLHFTPYFSFPIDASSSIWLMRFVEQINMAPESHRFWK